MSIQSFNTVTYALQTFADNHLTIKRFKTSFFEQFDSFSTSGNSFPIMYAVPNQTTIGENADMMSFRVYVVDILQKDRSNEGTILNETLMVLRDLNNWFKQDDNIPFNLLNDPRAYPVNNFLVDFTVGWYMDIDIEVESYSSDCLIPFSSNFQLTGFTCDVNYISPFLTCDTLEQCSAFIAFTNLIITGGTLNGNTLTLNQIGGTNISIGGFNVSTDDVYWTSGSTGLNSIKAKNTTGLNATGDYAIATGLATLARGEASSANGAYTSAIGNYSSAEGNDTEAGVLGILANEIINGLIKLDSVYGDLSADYNNADFIYLNDAAFTYNFGISTQWIDSSSFDGTNTYVQLVLNDGSLDTSPGLWVYNITNPNPSNVNNIVIGGETSHVEGLLAKTIGQASHAEGYDTRSIGNNSHTEGSYSIAIGKDSHAQGYTTTASGDVSHAEGDRTTSTGYASHAEGYYSVSTGYYSHAEGLNTDSIGDTSHAEGRNTAAIGTNSHSGGKGTTANGENSFVHGDSSTADGTNTIVLGAYITGSAADTTYVDNFNIKTVGVGSPIKNLGIDANGFVVEGGSLSFTGNTSNTCIDELYVNNLIGCTDINVGSDMISQVVLSPSTTNTILKSFDYSNDGGYPQSSPIAIGNILYGTTTVAGNSGNGYGTLYSYNLTTSTYTILKVFSVSADGRNPQSSPIAVGNILYGTTQYGGAGAGVLYSYNLTTSTYAVLKSFNNTNGNQAYASPYEVGGILYGTTYQGGTLGKGVLYSYNIATTVYTVIRNFNGTVDGQYPKSPVIEVSGKLYGTTSYGGPAGYGTLYSYNIATATYTVLHEFNGGSGSSPEFSTPIDYNGILYGTTYDGGANDFGVLYSYNIATSTYAIIYNFDYTSGNGRNPLSSPIAVDSILYGTTPYGGTNGVGVVYAYNIATSEYLVLRNFDGTIEGSYSYSSLFNINNLLYGTCRTGGSIIGAGTLFQLPINFASYSLGSLTKPFEETFTKELNISTLGTGTSVTNLGIDINGNVVNGTTTDNDIYVTGGTYSNGTTTLIRNDGGSVVINGFYTGSTGQYVNITGDTMTGDLYAPIVSLNNKLSLTNTATSVNVLETGASFVSGNPVTFGWSIYNAGVTTNRQMLRAFSGGLEAFRFDPNSTSWINTAGNLLIGTTTNGAYKLDVSGDTRVTGNLNITGTNNLIGPASANTSGLGSLRVSQGTSFVDIGESVAGSSAIWMNRTPTATNYALREDTAGNVNINGINNVDIRVFNLVVANFGYSSMSLSPNLTSGNAVTSFTLTKPNNTNQTLSTEIPGFKYNSGSRQWATGNIATQREMYFTSPIYSFVGSSTITNAYSMYIEAPSASTNTIITNNWALGLSGNLNVSGNTGQLNNSRFITGSGSTAGVVDIGQSIANRAAIWMLAGNGTVLTANNYAIAGDTLATYINSPNTVGGSVQIRSTNNYAMASWTRYEALHKQDISTSGAITPFTFTHPANTNQTLSTEIPGFKYNSGSRQWATGNITTQREVYFTSPIYSFASSSTITNAYSMFIEQPTVGSNATITNNYALGLSGSLQLTSGYKIEASGSSLVLNSTTSNVAIQSFGNNIASFATNRISMTPASTSGTLGSNYSMLSLTNPAHTNQQASTEMSSLRLNGGSRGWATGNITTQREVYFTSTSYSFTSASTITNAYGMYIEAPSAGINTTITNNYALGLSGSLIVSGVSSNIILRGSNVALERVQITLSGSITLGSSASVDYVYYVPGAYTASMPAPNNNKYTIKNLYSSNITIDTAGSELIEGAASISVSPGAAVDLLSNGTNWYIV